MDANVIRVEPVSVGQVDLGWMRGTALLAVEFAEPHHWTFLIGLGVLTTDSLWRARLDDRLLVTSGDHGQWYGLSDPVDSAERAAPLVGRRVVDVHIGPDADLTLTFVGGADLQILATSIGYEVWQVKAPNSVCFVAGGSGTFSTWRDEA
jgi:hypothetical protein